MNRQQAKALLPIIQAYADGKTIQAKYGLDEWVDLHDPRFDYYDCEHYRIKPELREWWICCRDGWFEVVNAGRPNAIRVREVLE